MSGNVSLSLPEEALRSNQVSVLDMQPAEGAWLDSPMGQTWIFQNTAGPLRKRSCKTKHFMVVDSASSAKLARSFSIEPFSLIQ